ncbi:MAG: class I SAM-dependent methyltransferase [bacterium]|nr:class I SAM-dependent methyltransferase [bacterium]
MDEELIKEYYEKNPEGIDPVFEIRELYEMHELIKKSVEKKSPTKLLDAGCGKGFTGNSVFGLCKEYHGFDISYSAVAIAKKRLPNGVFNVGSLKKLPYDDEEFDCVVCSEVLEHIPDYLKAMSELSRVTKMGGSLIITTPNKHNPDMTLRLYTKGRYTPQIYDSPIDYEELITQFKKRDLEIVEFKSFWFFPSLGEEMSEEELEKFMKVLEKLSDKYKKPLGLYLFFELRKLK